MTQPPESFMRKDPGTTPLSEVLLFDAYEVS
jgi:hypothetical protein